MDARHDDPELSKLESDADFTMGKAPNIVRAYRKVMNVIRQVSHEGELYQWTSLRFEKLKGKRSHQRSLRLNDQWRLIVEIEEREGGNCLVVKGIEDYH